MFGFLSSKPQKIGGYIGYYNLGEWLTSTFSQEEITHMCEVFTPMGVGVGTVTSQSSPLMSGSFLSLGGSAVSFLSNLSGWFNNPRDRSISLRILQKVNTMIDNASEVLDKHFAYQQMQETFYPLREQSPEYLELTIEACRKQIALAHDAAEVFRKEYPRQSLPAHAGYHQLVIILAKQGKYSEAVQLCIQAEQEGWNGDWAKRVAKYKDKEMKTLSLRAEQT